LHFCPDVRRCGRKVQTQLAIRAASTVMARKRKKKIFSAAKVVREMARERVGSPKPSRLVPAKTTKAEKHKPTLEKLLNDE
jgi:hypothetical protein